MKETRVAANDNFLQKHLNQFYLWAIKDNSTEKIIWDLNEHKGLFYNFYNENFLFSAEELLKEEPRPAKCWVHLSCGLWMPEMYLNTLDIGKPKIRGKHLKRRTNFKRNGRLLEIKSLAEMPQMPKEDERTLLMKLNKKKYELIGLKNIDLARFGWTCLICKSTSGTTLKCPVENCNKNFHVECAKRAKLVIESQNHDHKDFVLYCEAHTPLRFKKEVEGLRKKSKNEIIKFAKYLKKGLRQTLGNEVVNRIRRQFTCNLEEIDKGKSEPLAKQLKSKRKSFKEKPRKKEKKVKYSLNEKIRTLRSDEKTLLMDIKKEYGTNKDFFFVWDVNLGKIPEGEGFIHEQIRVNIPKKNIYNYKILKSNVIWKNLAKNSGSSNKKVYTKHLRIVDYIKVLTALLAL